MKSDEANITNLARRFIQIAQMGADLKRLRNLYSSDEQVHRMSKKRNKIILVLAMPAYALDKRKTLNDKE